MTFRLLEFLYSIGGMGTDLVGYKDVHGVWLDSSDGPDGAEQHQNICIFIKTKSYLQYYLSSRYAVFFCGLLLLPLMIL
jgi:hypothetical protein